MTDTFVAQSPKAIGSIDFYAAGYLLGFALGTVVAMPLVSVLYFSGPLGSMHEAAAPFTPVVSSWWARAAFVAMAVSSLLKGGQPSGVQTAACFAGVTWLAQSLLQSRVLGSDPLLSLALSALFGGLWLAASWPLASPKQGRFALAVVVVSFMAGVGVPVLVTYLRLGATR